MILQPPTQHHLERMYYELSKLGASALSQSKRKWPYKINNIETLIILAAQMSRYDPRLFSILTEFLFSYWPHLNPYQLRHYLLKIKTPQILLVVFSFIKNQIKNKEFIHYYDYLSQGWPPVSPQLFFLNLYSPGSRQMTKASTEPIQEFLDWGFLARERPILYSQNRKTIGSWGPDARKNIVSRLLNHQKKFTLSEYLTALDHTISRQQALNDLKQNRLLKMQGKGRGSFWVKKTHK